MSEIVRQIIKNHRGHKVESMSGDDGFGIWCASCYETMFYYKTRTSDAYL